MDLMSRSAYIQDVTWYVDPVRILLQQIMRLV